MVRRFLPRLGRVCVVVIVSLAGVRCDVSVRDREPAFSTTATTAPTPVLGPMPTIALFIGEPSRIFLGQLITLRWDVTLPSFGVASPLNVRVDPQPGAVPSTGVALVQPIQRGLFTAVLTAETTGGQRVSRFIQVLVE